MKYVKEEKQAFMDCVMKKYYPEILRITVQKLDDTKLLTNFKHVHIIFLVY